MFRNYSRKAGALLNPVPGGAAAFAEGYPFRHIVIENFLSREFCDRLIEQFPSFDPASAVNEHGIAGRKSVCPNLRALGRAYSEFDALIGSREFLETMSRVTGIPKLLYDPEYVGGGTHENLDGQDLDPHVDFNFHPRTRLHRRLNLIVFLNREWDASWGGCLDLMRDPWSPEGQRDRAVIAPLANRAVIFETNEISWHGFSAIALPVDKKELSRRSVAVYFYTREGPGNGAAPSHGTVYVQRQLGEHIRAGRTLTEEDECEIQQLIARRDSQIKFLYERELRFSKLIDGLTRSPSFRIGHALTWPARMLRKR